MLSVEDLCVEFVTERGVVRAVDGVSFNVEKGKTLGIVGESGCGKSVTALSLLRLLAIPPARIPRGRILFEGKNLLALSKPEMQNIRGSQIAMIFQEPMTSLNPVYTVGFQIAESIRIHRKDLKGAAIENRVTELLQKVGIPDPEKRKESYPHELSGGMRQRVMIAMALACEPKLLVADEPTTALDVTIQAQILELIKGLQKDLGMAVILITHDLGVVAETVDDVMVMYAGRAVEKAPVDELFRNPLHPYTKGLLASLPRKATAGQRLEGIKGSVPDLLNLPMGCRFQDRCSQFVESCREAEPKLELKYPGHEAACFEVKPIARGRRP